MSLRFTAHAPGCLTAKRDGEIHLLLVGLRADVLKDMRDAQLELVCYGNHPGVILSLKHLLWACQVQVTYRQREREEEEEGELEIYQKGKREKVKSDRERRQDEKREDTRRDKTIRWCDGKMRRDKMSKKRKMRKDQTK